MNIQQLHERLYGSTVSRGQLGLLIGITESMMSRILSGARPIPDDKFLERAEAAVTLLEQANEAANDARNSVIAKWPKISTKYRSKK